MGKTVPQSYYVPELDANIKVEFVSVNKYVANYPTGSERVKEADMKQGRWKHNGPWKDETLKDQVITLLMTALDEIANPNTFSPRSAIASEAMDKAKEMMK
jgi:hypothetical protein